MDLHAIFFLSSHHQNAHLYQTYMNLHLYCSHTEDSPCQTPYPWQSLTVDLPKTIDPRIMKEPNRLGH